nr:uncharacterized protein LOC127295428 [Lolium perenne]
MLLCSNTMQSRHKNFLAACRMFRPPPTQPGTTDASSVTMTTSSPCAMVMEFMSELLFSCSDFLSQPHCQTLATDSPRHVTSSGPSQSATLGVSVLCLVDSSEHIETSFQTC